MSPFEYSLILVTIIVGLAITDMLVSLHRLLRSRAKIRWHWLPIAAAVLVLLTLLQFWWGFHELGRTEVWSQYGAFLLLLLQLVLMFLLACAALPDEEAERADLARYYDDNRRYFWSLFALVAFMAIVVNVVVFASRGDPLPVILAKAVPNAIYIAIMLVLAFVRARVVHYALVLLLLVVMVLGWFTLRIQ